MDFGKKGVEFEKEGGGEGGRMDLFKRSKGN